MVFQYDNEKFSGVTNIGSHLLMSQVENNIKSFLDWGLLNIGAFINVSRNQFNIHGNPLHVLKPTEDPNYSVGQVWQTMRKDWVWEDSVIFNNGSNPSPSPSASTSPIPLSSSSISPSQSISSVLPLSISPIDISGIYINNVFYPVGTNDPAYGYYIDYLNSRVIFTNPISTSTIVEMEYSYRWAQIYRYDNAKWWQQLQYRTDENALHFNQIQNGDFSILSNNRVQLPAIIIESVARAQSEPYELGNKSLIVDQDLLLHVISENRNDRNILIDILRLQQDKVIWLYDTNKVIENNVYPFNINGSINSNRLNYDQLVKSPTYRWNEARLIDIYASDVQSFNPFLSEASIKVTVQIIFGIYN